MAIPAPQAALAPVTPRPFGWTRWLPVAVAGVLAAMGGLYLFWPNWRHVHAEGGPIEWMQLSCVLGAVLCAAGIVVRQRGNDRVNGVWFVMLFVLLAARELDLHEDLNEGVLGAWAVSYRLDWWTSFDVPLWPKLLWGGVGAVLGTVLAIPPLLVRAPALKLLRAGDVGAWLFIGGFACYASGYLLDDILGRGVLVHGDEGQVMEEFCELLGAVSFLASTIVMLRRPPTRGIAALSRPRTGA